MSTLQKSLISGGKYLAVNIFISAIGFFRSFLFMRELGMADLGMLSLFQTIIMFLGMLQFGLINGGYRMFALDDYKNKSAVNNLVFSYFAFLFTVFSLLWLFATIFNLIPSIDTWLLLASIFIGFLNLLVTWLTNTLIGKQLLLSLNRINIISGIGALLFLPLIFKMGIVGALIAIGIQPILFICAALLIHRFLRPTCLNFEKKLTLNILSYGFIPFLAGIFTVLMTQIERWSIAFKLGTSALGEFYLLFLYATLFTLIPSSLNNIFFPKGLRAYTNHDIPLLKKHLKHYYIILLAYVVFVSILSFLLMPMAIDFLLPQHVIGVKYVLLFIPGLIINTMVDPLSLFLNVTLRLSPLFYAGVFSTVLLIVLLWALYFTDSFFLQNIVYVKNIVSIFTFSFYCVIIIRIRKEIWFGRIKALLFCFSYKK